MCIFRVIYQTAGIVISFIADLPSLHVLSNPSQKLGFVGIELLDDLNEGGVHRSRNSAIHCGSQKIGVQLAQLGFIFAEMKMQQSRPRDA